MKKEYTLIEVEKHNIKEDCWIIIDSVVYDVTNYLIDHPGGEEILLDNAGKDCTLDFIDIHPDSAYKILENYEIGFVTPPIQLTDEPQENTYMKKLFYRWSIISVLLPIFLYLFFSNKKSDSLDSQISIQDNYTDYNKFNNLYNQMYTDLYF